MVIRMKNIRKEAKIKMKVTDIFKVIITAFLVVTFTVSIISCKEAPVVEEQVEEKQEEKGEVTIPSENKEETTETTQETTAIDMDKVKFWEAIVEGEKSYDITDKVLDYPMEEINILSNVVDGKIGTDEEILRFWELANKVQEDFFLAEMLIGGRLKEKGITPDEDMKNIINMIVEWADKMENSYSYYAKYLDTQQAEYDFKVDELKEEAGKIHSEYLELRHPFMKEYNNYNGIE